MNRNGFKPKIIGYICNWGAYSALEMAGIQRHEYPSSISMVRLTCLSRLHTGLVLKAFELGADGVVLFGCLPEQCHFKSGAEHAREVFNQSKKIMNLLGIEQKRLALIEVPLGGGEFIASKISDFVRQVKRMDSNLLSLNGAKRG